MASNRNKENHPNQAQHRQDLIRVEELTALEPYVGDIIEKLNADKMLALLTVADPVGVLREMGYELSRSAARELQRQVPRLSRSERDRYLDWLKRSEALPETFNLTWVSQPFGKSLLTQPETQMDTLPAAGEGGAANVDDFDVVAQLNQSLCDRLLKHHYAEGRTPRSFYRINNQLYHFKHTGEYQDYAAKSGQADREIHLAEPSLEFLPNAPDRARITSNFYAEGFNAKPVKGSLSILAKLAVWLDQKGHPNYIETSYDDLTAGDLEITAGTDLPAEFSDMLVEALKNFKKLSKPDEPHAPITMTMVDGDNMATYQISPAPGEIKFAARQLAGASDPILVIGFNRAERAGSGNLANVPDLIKAGGELAVMINSAWLEENLNQGAKQNLPTNFDNNTGLPNPNGDLTLNAMVWKYREDGITVKYTAKYQNDLYRALGVSEDINGQYEIDMTFHSTSPTLHLHVYADAREGWNCLATVFLAIFIVAVSALIGGAIGAYIGAAITGGTLSGTGASIGIAIGGGIGAGLGVFGSMYMLKWGFGGNTFNSKVTLSKNQEIKLTHQQLVPVSNRPVTVIPNDYKVSAQGRLMSAAVTGPVSIAAEPTVVVKGASPIVSIYPPEPAENAEGTALVLEDENKTTSLNQAYGIFTLALSPTALGEIQLHYWVERTIGMQGSLAYQWVFNSTPLGTSPDLKITLPITQDMLPSSGIEFNKVIQLGVLRLVVKDVFGRTAKWSGPISFGHAKDLRIYVPQLKYEPGFIDPITGMGYLRSQPPENLTRVAWVRNENSVPETEGRLLAYSSFTSPVSQDQLYVVCASS